MKFQFQTGSIKRIFTLHASISAVQFQFQTGSIKSHLIAVVKPLFELFQFQTGSIKSTPRSLFSYSNTSFNSKLVRLKERC